jgi:hypothetical protein
MEQLGIRLELEGKKVTQITKQVHSLIELLQRLACQTRACAISSNKHRKQRMPHMLLM